MANNIYPDTAQDMTNSLQKHTNTRHIFGKLFIMYLLVFFVQACATKNTLDNQAVITLNNNLASLNNWKLKGKIAWITPSERKSAYINWQQRGQAIEFKLTNLLGINLATLNYNNKRATLKSDGQTYSDPSPSQLIYQTTGWDVPILPLSSWIKGVASIDAREYQGIKNTSNRNNISIEQTITRFENGLIKQLIGQCSGCDAWQIDYKGYQSATLNNIEYQLPTTISLTNVRTRAIIKIRISEWSL